MIDLLKICCPECRGTNLKCHTVYETKHHGQRTIYRCSKCGAFFSSTANTILARLRKPISFIMRVIKARTEGQGLNATSRTFEISKNTIIRLEQRCAALKDVLLLYALLHQFLQLQIEGDEVYTRVGKNLPPAQSQGWTVVLMDRASRFLWELKCGKKDRSLFQKALQILGKLVTQTEDFTLLTDGERRYGMVLFEICFQVLHTGKKGRPRKTLRKGVKVRLKNKGSQTHKKGPKRRKYEAPCSEHPETIQDIPDHEIHANHCEAFNSALRRCLAAFRRATNTYAKKEHTLQRVLDTYWVVYNFMRKHGTTKQVPAVTLGILDRAWSWEEFFMIRMAA